MPTGRATQSLLDLRRGDCESTVFEALQVQNEEQWLEA